MRQRLVPYRLCGPSAPAAKPARLKRGSYWCNVWLHEVYDASVSRHVPQAHRRDHGRIVALLIVAFLLKIVLVAAIVAAIAVAGFFIYYALPQTLELARHSLTSAASAS